MSERIYTVVLAGDKGQELDDGHVWTVAAETAQEAAEKVAERGTVAVAVFAGSHDDALRAEEADHE